MKKKILLVLLVVISMLMVSACGNPHKDEPQYHIYELAVEAGFEGTYEEWLATVKGDKGDTGDKGEQGEKGEVGPQGPEGKPGKDGISVTKIEKTKTEGLVDTYTITYSDGKTTEFTVTNGADGQNGSNGQNGADGAQGEKGEQGIQGKPGADGKTPVITISDKLTWVIDGVDTKISVQGSKGDKGDAGENGKPGEKGEQGEPGKDGQPGADGKSAYEIYKAAHPEYTKSEAEWLDDLVNGRLGTVEETKYNVRFYTGTELIIPDQQVVKYGKVIKPTTPYRPGYNFLGWFIQDEKWVFNGYPVTSNMALVAKWELRQYDVEINYNNGNLSEIRKINHNEELVLENPTKEGYIFDSWQDDSGNVINMPCKITKALKINAIFRDSVHIVFDTDGGEPLEKMVVKMNDNITELPTPTKNACVFLGWFYNNGKEEVEFTIPQPCSYKKDIVLKAHWRVVAGDYEASELPDGTLKITNYKGSDVNVVVPNELNGKKVTAIGSDAFKNKINIVTLKLGDNIQTIEDNAFNGMTGLVEIEFNEVIKNYGLNLLLNDTSLTTITIPNNVQLLALFDYDELNIPASFYKLNVKYITRSDDVYAGDQTIAAILLTNIKSTNLTVELVGEWRYLFDSEFSSSKTIEKVILPKTLLSIPFLAFSSCTGLKSVEIKEGVRSIGDSSFYNCVNLTDIKLPSTVTSIATEAFENCTGLRNIVLPENLNSIGRNVFENCSSLYSVVIPKSLSRVGGPMFNLCGLLSNVFYTGSKAEWNKINTEFGSNAFATVNIEYDSKVTNIDYVENSEYRYLITNTNKVTLIECMNKNASNIDLVTDFKDKELITLAGHSDSGYCGILNKCNNINTLVIPDTVTLIGSYSFAKCTTLRNIIIPNNVKCIGSDAFRECHNLTTVILSNNLNTIGSSAFYECVQLKEIIIPSSVKIIGIWAFYGCNVLNIKCEIDSKPIGWADSWNLGDCPVEWNYKQI